MAAARQANMLLPTLFNTSELLSPEIASCTTHQNFHFQGPTRTMERCGLASRLRRIISLHLDDHYGERRWYYTSTATVVEQKKLTTTSVALADWCCLVRWYGWHRRDPPSPMCSTTCAVGLGLPRYMNPSSDALVATFLQLSLRLSSVSHESCCVHSPEYKLLHARQASSHTFAW